MKEEEINSRLNEQEKFIFALMKIAFSDGEVTTLAFDRFHNAYHEFGDGMSKLDKIRLIIEHAVYEGRVQELGREIAKRNPGMFALNEKTWKQFVIEP